ncbi:hypothetical protein EBME_1975 [bacterium endosymbiont of Mortierella elongata FMR23-6]|nr:hypothetical protein EBME_1975 [bacterium endosymbiont of Mortierella elongata FMR23-6]
MGQFSFNVIRRKRIASINLVPKRSMLSGPSSDVIGPLHLCANFLKNIK